MSIADRLYSFLPTSGQNIAATGFGYYRKWQRFGPRFEHRVRTYLDREYWDVVKLREFQSHNLISLLTSSSKFVPYYRRTWSEVQKQAARLGRLTELPLLNKDPVRTNPQDFARDDIRPHPCYIYHTSGSSGTPISAYWTTEEVRDSRALREARLTRWAGVSFREARATFSGRIVVNDPNSKGPFHRFNRAENQVYFSAFHLSPNNAAQYVSALAEHNIQWLHGYAYSYYLLARYIVAQNLTPPPLKAIVTTSEKVTSEMRSTLQKAFGCRVYEEYSTVENAVFASECELGSLHLSSDAGVMEILRADGSPCDPGEIGEVVSTSFVRKYQPFVRFRVGDMAAWGTDPCPCGRSLPVIREVVGRLEDVVIGPDGREMVRFHGIFADQENVVEGQIVQESLDCIRANVVATDKFGERDVNDIKSRIRQRLGDVQVIVDPVQSIPRTKAGKFQAVVSLLK